MATKAPAAAAPRPEPRSDSQSGGNVFTRFWRFCKESVSELKKVEWPGQNQVIQGTVVVLVACIITGTYLYVNDQVWQHVVKRILGQ
jgi:preprotein translocase subunit SecE